MIATRDFNNSDNSDEASQQIPVTDAGADEAYEVRRSRPRHGDSYVGGLDILTVHRMIEEQNLGEDSQDSSESN